MIRPESPLLLHRGSTPETGAAEFTAGFQIDPALDWKFSPFLSSFEEVYIVYDTSPEYWVNLATLPIPQSLWKFHIVPVGLSAQKSLQVAGDLILHECCVKKKLKG